MESDWVNAVAELQAASKPRFGDATVHARLGSAWSKAGDLDRGIEQLRTALRLDPGSAGNHYTLARMFLKKGDQRAAAEEFRAQARVDRAREKGDGAGSENLSHIARGLKAMAPGNGPNAVGAFDLAGQR